MKKVKLLIAFAFLFAWGINITEAEELAQCSDSSSAKNVKVKYETKYEKIPEDYNPCGEGNECDQNTWTVAPPDGHYYNLIISNLTDDMYVKITNDYNDNYDNEENGDIYPAVDVINSNEFKNGVLTYKSLRIFTKVNYTVNIYSTSGNCLLKTLKITTPLYNSYVESNSDLCSKISDFKYCQTWIDDEITDEKFYEEAQKYAEQKDIDIKEEIPESYEQEDVKTTNNSTIIKLVLVSVVIIALIAFIIVNFKVWGKRK